MERLMQRYQAQLDRTKTDFVRYLHDEIRWEARLNAILGARGVGKTTLMFQHILLSGERALLADEMGLGKTLQMLALLAAGKEAGEVRPSLVVCPASLVYNWKEECSRFTPALSAQTLDGTLSQRKAMLKEIADGQGADLYITSYDLLKRDITLYVVVSAIQSDHCFALTGTPI